MAGTLSVYDRARAVMPGGVNSPVRAMRQIGREPIFIERGEGSDFEISQRIRGRLAERLPAYMLPRKFLFLPGFPMTPNGKVDRSKLSEMLE